MGSGDDRQSPRPRTPARTVPSRGSAAIPLAEAHIDRPGRRRVPFESAGRIGTFTVDPVQEQVRRPAIRVWRRAAVPMVYAAIYNRVAWLHRDRVERLTKF